MELDYKAMKIFRENLKIELLDMVSYFKGKARKLKAKIR